MKEGGSRGFMYFDHGKCCAHGLIRLATNQFTKMVDYIQVLVFLPYIKNRRRFLEQLQLGTCWDVWSPYSNKAVVCNGKPIQDLCNLTKWKRLHKLLKKTGSKRRTCFVVAASRACLFHSSQLLFSSSNNMWVSGILLIFYIFLYFLKNYSAKMKFSLSLLVFIMLYNLQCVNIL